MGRLMAVAWGAAGLMLLGCITATTGTEKHARRLVRTGVALFVLGYLGLMGYWIGAL